MHLLPNTLAPLANAADPKEGSRWAVTGVHLRLLPGGGWEATATDTKQLLQVTGAAAMTTDEFPTWKALEDAPNSACEALVPADHWAATFAAAKKLAGKRRFPAAPKAVAVKLAPALATFGFTDREANKTEGTKLVEGKFPPVEVVWPKRKPTLTLALDPKRLGGLLKTMAAMLPDGEQRIEFDIYDGTKPVILRTSTPEMELKGLVMPLGEKDGESPAASEADTAAESPDGRRAELAAVTAERDALRRELAGVRRELELSLRDARDCAAERDAARDELARMTARRDSTATPTPAPTAVAPMSRRERLGRG